VQVLGFLSLAGGLFLKFGLSVLLDIPTPLSSMVDQVNTAPSPSSSSLEGGVSSVSQLSSAADVASYILLALGVFMFIVGLVGCLGACCTFRALLAMV